jgi:hypothetical protein
VPGLLALACRSIDVAAELKFVETVVPEIARAGDDGIPYQRCDLAAAQRAAIAERAVQRSVEGIGGQRERGIKGALDISSIFIAAIHTVRPSRLGSPVREVG